MPNQVTKEAGLLPLQVIPDLDCTNPEKLSLVLVQSLKMTSTYTMYISSKYLRNLGRLAITDR